MKMKNQKLYVSPLVETITVEVESVFAVSGVELGNDGTLTVDNDFMGEGNGWY